MNIDIDEKLVPEGFDPVRVGFVTGGQWYLGASGPVQCHLTATPVNPVLILRPKQPRRWLVEEGPIGSYLPNAGKLWLKVSGARQSEETEVRIVREITVPDGEFAEVEEGGQQQWAATAPKRKVVKFTFLRRAAPGIGDWIPSILDGELDGSFRQVTEDWGLVQVDIYQREETEE